MGSTVPVNGSGTSTSSIVNYGYKLSTHYVPGAHVLGGMEASGVHGVVGQGV